MDRARLIMEEAKLHYKSICNLPNIEEIVTYAFVRGARWADANPVSRRKEEILKMLDAKYGTDLSLRLEKLAEECNELQEAANKNVPNPLTIEHCVDYTRDVLDELSDVNILIFHIAGIIGVSQDELLSMAVDKIKGREKDPNYKRKHPHK